MAKGIDIRRMREEESDNEGSWAVSYGDMVTLLLTFFILFFSINPKKKQMENLNAAIMKELAANPNIADKVNGQTGTLTFGNTLEEGVDKDILKRWKGKAHEVGHKILVEFPEVSFFGSGMTEVTDEGKENLIKFAKSYMPYIGHYTVGIRAFTDNKKVMQNKERRFKDNLELSALRGIAAMRILQKNGIPLDRLKVGGYGENIQTAGELAKVNQVDDVKALSLSRKVVLVIEPEGTL